MPAYGLRPFRPEDASAVHELQERYAAEDLVDVCSTIAPVLDRSGVEHRMRAATWAVVAADLSAGWDSVVGWGSLRSWREDDGTRVYLTDGYVAPPVRGRGLGTRLLASAESKASRTADDSEDREVVLGGNASTVQPARAALLQRHGYQAVFSMVEMEHDRSPVRRRPLPAGVTVRAATVGDAGPLRALAARTWAGRRYSALPTEDRLREWLARSELALFQVATVDDRLVGFVAASHTPVRAEIEDVQVDPDLQRRGLATAMMTEALAELADRGDRPVRLHTEGQDPAGARSLYERLGFQVVSEHWRYRKPMITDVPGGPAAVLKPPL